MNREDRIALIVVSLSIAGALLLGALTGCPSSARAPAPAKPPGCWCNGDYHPQSQCAAACPGSSVL